MGTRPQTVQVFWVSAKFLHGTGTCQITVQSHAENALLAALRLVASQLVGARVETLHGVVSQLVEAHARTRPQTVQVNWAIAKILHGPGTCQITVQGHAENALLAALRLVA